MAMRVLTVAATEAAIGLTIVVITEGHPLLSECGLFRREEWARNASGSQVWGISTGAL
jgi:hypothetical protein